MRRTINPFPGLRSFQTEEKYLFFGREDHTAELLRRLRETRFLAVVGTSGCGKSSLVKAGVLPELHKGTMTRAGSSWEVAIMRPGASPMTNLAKALIGAELYDTAQPDVVEQVRATISRSRYGLSEAVRQSDLEQGSNLLVVIDQFEELFRFGGSLEDQAESFRFVQLLLAASAEQLPPIYVVATMRSDYLGECTAFPGLAEAVNASEFLIPRMDRDQRRSAIEGPVRVAGAVMAPRLLQKLLNDLGDDPDQLPILQHALMRTWDEWEASGGEAEPIDLEHYEGAGGMREALSRHADEIYTGLPDDRHRCVAAKIFKALTEWGSGERGIRRPNCLERLCEIADATEEETRTVIEAFRAPGRTFLMPPGETDLEFGTVIDISHESLMRVWLRLRDWTVDEERSASIYRRLADTARLWEEGMAGLYLDPDLQIARTWREETNPNTAWATQYRGGFETATAFLEASQEAAEEAGRKKEASRRRELEQAQQLAMAERSRAEEQTRSARRMRWLVAGMGVLSVLAIVAMLVARSARRDAQQALSDAASARDQARKTLSNKGFRVAAVLNRGGKSREAVAQLCEAVRNDPGNGAAKELLLSILLFEPVPVPLYQIDPLPGNEPPKFVVSLDGSRMVGYTEQSAVAWDLISGERLTTPVDLKESGGMFPEENVLNNYADEMAISLIGAAGCIRFDLRSGSASTHELAPRESGEIGLTLRNGIAWQLLARDDGVKIVDLRNRGEVLPVTFEGTNEAVRAITGPKGRWIAVETQGDEGNHVHLFDIKTGRRLRPEIPNGDLGKMATDSNGTVIIFGFEEGLINGWAVDGKDPDPVLSQKLPRSDVTPVSLCSETKRLTLLDDKGVYRLWDLELKREVTPHIGRQDFVTRGVGQDGKIAISISGDGRIWAWETSARQQIPMALSDRIPDAGIEWVKGGGQILRTLDSRIVEVVDLPGGVVSMQTPQHLDKIEFISASRSGDRFVTVAGNLLQIWQRGSPDRVGHIDLERDPIDICLFPDGSRLALATDTGVSIWSLNESGPVRDHLFPTADFVEVLEVNTEGTVLALVKGGDGSGIELRSTASGELLHKEYLRNPSRVVALEFSGDRLYAASGKSVRTWSVSRGEEIAEPIVHESNVGALAVGPDGQRLLTMTRRGSGEEIRIWDSRTSAQVSPAIYHEIGGQGLGFSADGSHLLTGQHVWELPPDGVSLPDWFIEFAEAAVGFEVAPSGVNEVLAPGEFLGAIEALAERTGPEEVLRFARWFATPRSARTLSPRSDLEFRDYITRLEAENSPASLDEASKLRTPGWVGNLER